MEGEQGVSNVLEMRLRDRNAKPTDLPLSLFKSITRNFSDDLKIGRGGFGVVYKGVLCNGDAVAVKKLPDLLFEDKSFLDEAACLMKAKHIVRFLGYCADTQGIIMKEYEGKYVFAEVRFRLLCFEYIGNGSLRSHLTDSEAAKVEYVEVPEEQQKYEEVLKMVSVTEGFSEATNLARTQETQQYSSSAEEEIPKI